MLALTPCLLTPTVGQPAVADGSALLLDDGVSYLLLDDGVSKLLL